jgi:hypothetical protein
VAQRKYIATTPSAAALHKLTATAALHKLTATAKFHKTPIRRKDETPVHKKHPQPRCIQNIHHHSHPYAWLQRDNG